MTLGWKEEAKAFFGEFCKELPASVTVEPLSDKLEMYTLQPTNPSAAPMHIAVSRDEVIISAGYGTRFELGPLEASQSEVQELLHSVINGHLIEHVGPRSVKYELRTSDGRTFTGRSSRGLNSSPGDSGELRYAPYSNS